MTNPGPRPALRKAPDAHIHPALSLGTHITIDLRDDRPAGEANLSKAPVPGASSPDTRVKPSDESEGAKKRKKHLRSEKADERGRRHRDKHWGKVKGKDRAKNSKRKNRSKSKKNDDKAAKANKLGADTGKKAKRGSAQAIALVPRDVRQKLRSGPKARGTSIDEVVTSVLEGWSPR